jgi:hypothetical protein
MIYSFENPVDELVAYQSQSSGKHKPRGQDDPFGLGLPPLSCCSKMRRDRPQNTRDRPNSAAAAIILWILSFIFNNLYGTGLFCINLRTMP